MLNGVESLEIAGDPSKIMEFGIKDPLLIIEYMTTTIYSNPLRIMCQEIMTNSRDANIEAGRGNEAIQITLPTIFDNNLIIQDHGIGINPDRIENVFINYGSSTKRNTDKQVGGFGIGAKTPFAYSHTFLVSTVSRDVNGDKKKYIYSMIKEGTGIVPKAIKVSENDTTENLGTSITIPIQTTDISKVRGYIASLSHKWKVRPIITNSDEDIFKSFDDKKRDYIIDTPEYKMYKKDSNNYQFNCDVYIENIPYSIKTDVFEKFINISSKYAFEFYFKTGELHVSLSRENIHYDVQTMDKIKTVCNKLMKDVQQYSQNVISQQKSYLEACEIFQLHIDLMGKNKQSWNNIPTYSFYDLFHMLPFEYQIYESRMNLVSKRISYINHYHNNVFINDIANEHKKPYVRGFYQNDLNAHNSMIIAHFNQEMENKILLDEPSRKIIIDQVKKELKNISSLPKVEAIRVKNIKSIDEKDEKFSGQIQFHKVLRNGQPLVGKNYTEFETVEQLHDRYIKDNNQKIRIMMFNNEKELDDIYLMSKHFQDIVFIIKRKRLYKIMSDLLDEISEEYDVPIDYEYVEVIDYKNKFKENMMDTLLNTIPPQIVKHYSEYYNYDYIYSKMTNHDFHYKFLVDITNKIYKFKKSSFISLDVIQWMNQNCSSEWKRCYERHVDFYESLFNKIGLMWELISQFKKYQNKYDQLSGNQIPQDLDENQYYYERFCEKHKDDIIKKFHESINSNIWNKIYNS